MIPCEAKRGRSFLGAGLYYLHDKEAQTSERVAFTHTENLPTDDPDMALRVMAATAMDAPALKRAAGVKRAGGRSEKPVFCFSLSWHPEEQPKKWDMVAAGRQALAALGLIEHETLMVAHRDEAHPHLHLIVNAINPNDGRASSLKFSRQKLSRWAEEYEREHGKIYCRQRVENNERRKKKERVRYKDPELEQKAVITKLYHAADNGKAFQAALNEAGYKLAQSKRLVLIDREGKIHSLARQIEGVKAQAIRKKLADLQLSKIEEARGAAGGDQEGPRPEAPRQREAEAQGGRQSPSLPSARRLNRTQDRHLAELGEFYTESQRKRAGLRAVIDKQYGQDERRLRREIAELDEILKNNGKARLWALRRSGHIPKDAEKHLENMRRSLENIEWRKGEMQQALESEIKENELAIKARQGVEHGQLESGFPAPQQENAGQNTPTVTQDFERAAKQAEYERRLALYHQQNQQEPERDIDRDQGPSLERE
jgi:Relaxase/Mobilisation nuclease domain